MKVLAKDKRQIDLKRTGHPNDDSLFSWVHDRWGQQRKGILVCDDGSGEIADFVHLAPKDADGVSALTFVHVKASASKRRNRRLSVGCYELVVSQAVKNLSYVSPDFVSKKLRAYSKSAQVWTDGKLVGSATTFADELDTRGDLVGIRVVVVQPQTLESTYFPRQKKVTGAVKARQDQLSALLLEAEASCRGVGATFSVIASK